MLSASLPYDHAGHRAGATADTLVETATAYQIQRDDAWAHALLAWLVAGLAGPMRCWPGWWLAWLSPCASGLAGGWPG